MTPLSEESIRRLMELLGECRHEVKWRDVECYNYGRPYHQYREICIKCGQESSVIKETRAFTTWQDLGDVKEALVKQELWDEFIESLIVWRGYRQFSIEEIAAMTEKIFLPADENGNAHFCRLVDEFLKEKEEAING